MPKFKTLPKSFYEPSAKVVAPLLLGHWLIRNTPEGPSGGAIVEVEAYLSDDPACHGAPGPTPLAPIPTAASATPTASPAATLTPTSPTLAASPTIVPTDSATAIPKRCP